MNGARFVHDTPEDQGWEVLVADAQKVKELARLACKTDRIKARALAELSWPEAIPSAAAWTDRRPRLCGKASGAVTVSRCRSRDGGVSELVAPIYATAPSAL